MSKKILVIDDSPTVLGMLGSLLGQEGYQVASAGSGEEGVRMAGADKPDAAVIDTILPDMDGFEVCRRIKALSPGTRVVVMTGNVDAVDAIKARKAGADDYCVKTGDLSPLLLTLKNLIE